MAISQTYCDFATGNDYSGPTFTDGAYTASTKTLVKSGAFAKTKPNHWLYLTSNDGGSIVAGYYKVATVPDANTVTLATDAGAGVDDDAAKCVQHDGTISLPWRSVQGALDLCTRNATDGNQVNVKAGTAQVNAATWVFTVFGGASREAPLVVRGYTATANDGGIGEIDAGGATLYTTTFENIALIDLEIHTFGDNHGIYSSVRNLSVIRCEVHKGASSPSAKALIYGRANLLVAGCHIHDPNGGNCIQAPGTSVIANNYIQTDGGGVYAQLAPHTDVVGNVIVLSTAGGTGIIVITPGTWGPGGKVAGNIVYNTAAGTAAGIYSGNAGYLLQAIMNNICVGFSGAGGAGINAAGHPVMLGYNAFYNNTANYTAASAAYEDLRAFDVALVADPFTDAENGDFSLTTAGKAALRGLGWPGAYLGANAATDGHVTIGAIQYGEAEAGGGGFPKIASLLGRTRM